MLSLKLENRLTIGVGESSDIFSKFNEEHLGRVCMKMKPQPDALQKWSLYTPQQQEIILAEFRKKLPNDYYCKTTLFKFLEEKIEPMNTAEKRL